jgi:hypothetical protein
VAIVAAVLLNGIIPVADAAVLRSVLDAGGRVAQLYLPPSRGTVPIGPTTLERLEIIRVRSNTGTREGMDDRPVMHPDCWNLSPREARPRTSERDDRR